MKAHGISVFLALALLHSAAFAAEPPEAPESPLKPPEGANALEKTAWFVNNQLIGKDFYEPANYMFFRQAVKTIGFFPAIFATADRILRDSRIGTASNRTDADNPVIKEGPEAYAPGRAGREKQ